ncbi:MAG TPA: PilN domain-containing protein [Nitrospiria bacterium]|jgi:type IV pilus assembly protein PilN
MIKINLLPSEGARKVKKKNEGQAQFVIAGASVFITFLFCVYFFWYVPNGKITQLQIEHTNAQKELQKLKEQVKVVDNYESNKKVLQRKNEIIKNLRKKQSRPVHLLDDLSNKLPDRVWLKSFSESKGVISIEGKALSNSDIVDYIANLKSSQFFLDVQLEESRKTIEKNIPIYNFKLKVKMVV